MDRYQRQIILSEIGFEGQKRLSEAHVGIVGVGGLGCPAALYLAAAGVGFLRLIDADRIDRTNLQRQILFQDDETGQLKVEVAQKRLRAQNPDITVESRPERLNADNVSALIADLDLVIDASDNFETRRLTNRFSVDQGVALIQASLFQFEGQIMTFAGGGAPCYQCLYPVQPPAPNCAEAGVIGALAGVLGSLQAMEAIRFFTQFGKPFGGTLLRYHALKSRWSELELTPDPACPECHGERKTNLKIAKTENPKGNLMSFQVTPTELKQRLDAGEKITLLDVREPEERAIVNIGGAFIPLGDLPARHHELDPEKEIIIYCHHGVRSLHALGFLQSQGFSKVKNLQGGIDRYSLEADPRVARY